MVHLIFLGTKGEIEEYSKKHKYHSSLLIEYKNFKLMIDYGEIHKYSLEKIKPNAILITHAHPDHYIWTLKNFSTETAVYLTKKTLEYGKFKPENYKIIKSGRKFKLGHFLILPFKVLHSLKCPSIGFKIFINKKKIVYTGDVVDIINKKKILRSVNYYIGDGSSIRANLIRRKGKNLFGHARITTQIKWCKGAKIKNMIFTHLGKETIKKEKQFKKQNPEIIIAHDGMKIKI